MAVTVRYFAVVSPDDASPFGAATRHSFTATGANAAAALAVAQAEVQSLSSLLGVNLYLEDVTSTTLGVQRTKFTPAGGATVTINTGISHK